MESVNEKRKSMLDVLQASELAFVETLGKFRRTFVAPLELQDTKWKEYLFKKPETALFTSLFDQITHLNQRFQELLIEAAEGKSESDEGATKTSPAEKRENVDIKTRIRNIARLFNRFGPLFEMYCQYASVQQGAYGVITKGMTKEKDLETFVEKFESEMHSPIRLLIKQHVENLLGDLRKKRRSDVVSSAAVVRVTSTDLRRPGFPDPKVSPEKKKRSNARGKKQRPKVAPPPPPKKKTKPKKGTSKVPPPIPSKKLKGAAVKGVGRIAPPIPKPDFGEEPISVGIVKKDASPSEASSSSSAKSSSFRDDVLRRVPSMRQKGLRPLQMWMLLPTWRVREYVQIVEGLMKAATFIKSAADEGASDAEREILQSLTSAREVLMAAEFKISEALLESTHLQVLRNLEGEFAGNVDLIEAGRKFVMKGKLRKQSRKKAIPYTFHLFSDMMTYSADSNTGGFTLHRAFSLDDCMVRAVDGESKSFTFLSTKKSFDIICKDVMTRDRWFKALQRCIKETRESSNKEVATVFAAPWNPDETTMHCMLCKSKFTMLNRKHHCRSCGRVICGSCGKFKRVLQNIAEKPERICVNCNDEIRLKESKMFRWQIEVMGATIYSKEFDAKCHCKVELRQAYQHSGTTAQVQAAAGKISFKRGAASSFVFPAASVPDSLVTLQLVTVSSMLSSQKVIGYAEIFGSTIARLNDKAAVTKLLEPVDEDADGDVPLPPPVSRVYDLNLRPPPGKEGSSDRLMGKFHVKLTLRAPVASVDGANASTLFNSSQAALKARPVAPLLISHAILCKTMLASGGPASRANASKRPQFRKDLVNEVRRLRKHPAVEVIGSGVENERHDGASGGSTQALSSQKAVEFMKGLSPSQRVLYEIVCVSETFSKDLDTLIRVFVTPLERAAHGGKLVVSDQSGRRVARRESLTKRLLDGSGKVGKRGLLGGLDRVSKLLRKPDVKVLLSSIRQIALLNEQFTQDLKEKTAGWPPVIYTADVFVHFASVCSRSFGTFARSHAQGVQYIEDEVFSEFMQTVREVTGADCRSLLGKPAVYVPRVRLQMQELLKQLRKKQPDHPDLPSLEKALGEVAEAGVEINKLVDKRECKLELVALSKRFTGFPSDLNILDKERKVLKQGVMLKQCRRKAKPFYFVLLSDLLLYGDGGEDGGSIAFHRVLRLNETIVKNISEDIAEKQTGRKYAFEIVSRKKSFVVYLEKASAKASWWSEMEKAVKENRPEDGGVTFAATWLHDSAVKACQACETKFTFINRRHHCRACGEVVCDSCSRHRILLKHIHETKKQRVCDKCFVEPSRYRVSSAGSAASKDVPAGGDSDDDSDSE